MPTNPAAEPLYREVTRAALIGLGVNLTLGVVKLVAGIFTRSYALVSDSINSLGDSLSTIIVLLALRVAQRPPDEEHPYGHTRAEAIAATNMALLIALAAIGIGWQSIHDWVWPSGEPPAPLPTWAFAIAAANVVIKEILFRYKSRVGKRTGSAAIITNAWDHRADAFSALAVMIGLAFVRWGGPEWQWADKAAALVVAATIIVMSARLYFKNASDLMDAQADGEIVDEIRAAAEKIPGVLNVEKLRVRKSGLEFFIDIHVEVDRRLTVVEGHEIAHRVKDVLVENFDAVRDVLVHIEPHEETTS